MLQVCGTTFPLCSMKAAARKVASGKSWSLLIRLAFLLNWSDSWSPANAMVFHWHSNDNACERPECWMLPSRKVEIYREIWTVNSSCHLQLSLVTKTLVQHRWTSPRPSNIRQNVSGSKIRVDILWRIDDDFGLRRRSRKLAAFGSTYICGIKGREEPDAAATGELVLWFILWCR